MAPRPLSFPIQSGLHSPGTAQPMAGPWERSVPSSDLFGHTLIHLDPRNISSQSALNYPPTNHHPHADRTSATLFLSTAGWYYRATYGILRCLCPDSLCTEPISFRFKRPRIPASPGGRTPQHDNQLPPTPLAVACRSLTFPVHPLPHGFHPTIATMLKLNLFVLTLLFILSVVAAAPRELKQAKIKRGDDDYVPQRRHPKPSKTWPQ